MALEMMRARATLPLALTVLLAAPAAAPGAPPRARLEIPHVGHGHEVNVSAPAVAVVGGEPVVAWVSEAHGTNVLWVARPASGEAPVRVNPESSSVDSLHQSPGLAVGPGGELYVSWSAAKPKAPNVLFASDLYLSRSSDGGRTFDSHLRVNEDRPTSHSFEGLAVAPDGTALVGWIDSREGSQPATYLARVVDRGTRVERIVRLEDGETCVCCRVDVSAGPGEAVAVLWRKVFPGDVRDMVLVRSRDGGRAFDPPMLVHADRWKIPACPHRGGSLATDARGRLYAAWYTEGTQGQPAVLFATAAEGRPFATPKRVSVALGSIPDRVHLAVGPDGRGIIVWEDATAVRKRILARAVLDGGRTLGAVRVLSEALKAWAPDIVAAGPDFVVVWHEERFPRVTTIVQRIRPER